MFQQAPAHAQAGTQRSINSHPHWLWKAENYQQAYMKALASILLSAKNWCYSRARHLWQNTFRRWQRCSV